MTRLATINLLVVATASAESRALDATSEVGLLSLVVKTFHPVLDLVQTFLFAVKAFDAHQVEAVSD